jgi:glycosyltransferase involved in cell wall biosynthesis
MITYNHEKYIANAIESVLMQKTNFDYELVIGEDFSTDKTPEIAISYKNINPEKIRVLLNNKNLGMIPNFLKTLTACRGKYIAILEGDDYWTDPCKLQKQLEILEANPKYVICAHDVNIVFEGVKEHNVLNNFAGHEFEFKDVLFSHFIPTNSLIFKNNVIREFPGWYYKCLSGDIFLELMLLDHANGYFLHEKMATKRKHPEGVSQRYIDSLKVEKNRLDMYYGLLKYSKNNKKIIKKRIAELELKVGRESIKRLFLVSGGAHFLRSFKKHLEVEMMGSK